MKSNPTTVHNAHTSTYRFTRLASTSLDFLHSFLPLSFFHTLFSSFLLLLFLLFFLYSPCPSFAHWPGCPGLATFLGREPSRLWLPSTLLLLLLLLREVPEVGRGPRYRFVENLLRHLLRQPPSFSSYVSLLCNEPAKICLEKFLILGGDPSLREISDGESFALPFFRSVAGMLI